MSGRIAWNWRFFFFGSKKNIFSKRNIVFSGKKFFKCMITVSRVFYFLKTIKTSDNRVGDLWCARREEWIRVYRLMQIVFFPLFRKRITNYSLKSYYNFFRHLRFSLVLISTIVQIVYVQYAFIILFKNRFLARISDKQIFKRRNFWFSIIFSLYSISFKCL